MGVERIGQEWIGRDRNGTERIFFTGGGLTAAAFLGVTASQKYKGAEK